MVQNMSSAHHDNTTNLTFTCYTYDRFGKVSNHSYLMSNLVKLTILQPK